MGGVAALLTMSVQGLILRSGVEVYHRAALRAAPLAASRRMKPLNWKMRSFSSAETRRFWQSMAPALHTRYAFSLTIRVGAPIVAGDFGYGARRIIPILGGEVFGEGIKGTILPYGADFQTIRPNGFTELEAKYAFQMDDGAIVYIENIGIRFGRKELLDRIAQGETVDPASLYFRPVPKFETGTSTDRRPRQK